MEELDYGYIKIKLDDLIEKQGISKNKLAHRAEMQRTQLNLLEYIPPKEDK